MNCAETKRAEEIQHALEKSCIEFLDNLTLVIKHAHIRYEDDYLSANPFSLGLILQVPKNSLSKLAIGIGCGERKGSKARRLKTDPCEKSHTLSQQRRSGALRAMAEHGAPRELAL